MVGEELFDFEGVLLELEYEALREEPARDEELENELRCPPPLWLEE